MSVAPGATAPAIAAFASEPGPVRRRPVELATLAGVTALALFLDCWRLSINGLGNQYYAAAARSMTTSWHNFFFASFDPGGFISVDKPPVALWIEALSARAFGVGSWSLLLPGAIAGAAAVALLWCMVRPRFGFGAATIAALVLALSPVNVAVNRLNDPEPFLLLFLVAAAGALLRSLETRRWWWWVLIGGVLVGVAFNTKMLAAFIPVPALALALLVGGRGWRERLGRLALFGTAALVVSASWMTVVDVSPGSSRPYVGGSSDNTVWDLVVGYNGIGRVDGGTMGAGPGRGPGGAGPGTAMSAAGGVFGGTAGPFRLVSDAVGGQIAWLLPLALVGLVAAAWLHRRDRRRRAAVVLWSGWLLLYGVVFSSATGIFHSYYTSLLTPAIAAAVGIGGAALLTLARRSRGWFATALAGAVVTIGLQLELSGRVHDFYGWTRAVLIVLALGATTAVVIGIARRRGRTVAFALTAGLSALLLTPAAWALSETANPVLNSTLPQAGPRAGAAATTFGSAASNGDPALARFLLDRRRGERWDLVVSSAQSASGLIADEGLSVMALGGFMGSDPSTSPAAFADRVAAGEVRFVLVSGGMFGGGAGILPGGARLGAGGARGPGGSGFGGGSTASTIMGRVEQACSAVTADALPARYAGSLYDCRGAAGALRAPS